MNAGRTNAGRTNVGRWPIVASGNLRGIILMVLSMAGFAVEDQFLKTAYAHLPVGALLAWFGAGGTLVFSVLVWRSGAPLLPRAMLCAPVGLRALSEVCGRIFYTLAIALSPLSTASAILQATPLVVTLGAAMIFGETVGWRRWLAIAVGFVGVLVLLRPGLSGFTPASAFALLGTLGFAGRDLATRAAPSGLSNLQLGVYGFAVLVPTGLIMWAASGGAIVPAGPDALRLIGAIGFGTGAYYALTAAMRIGDVAIVTPFRYTRLIFAMILGISIFGERPDALTLVGAAIIVAAGLYTIVHARRRL